MEFRFKAEEEKFRSELREFLKNELPEDWTGGMDEENESWDFVLIDSPAPRHAVVIDMYSP